MTGWCVITGSTSSKPIHFSFVASQSTKGSDLAGFSARQQVAPLSYIDLFLSSLVLLVLVVTVKGLLLSNRWARWDEKQLIAQRVWQISGRTFCFYVRIRRASVSTTSSSPAENALRCRTFASWAACECRTDELWPGEEHKRGQLGHSGLADWVQSSCCTLRNFFFFFFQWYCWPFFFLVVFFTFTIWPKLVSA